VKIIARSMAKRNAGCNGTVRWMSEIWGGGEQRVKKMGS